MSSRSWMTFLCFLSLGLLAPVAVLGDEPVKNTVRLELQITGLTGKNCLLSIRPSHPGCSFDPIDRRIELPSARSGMVPLKPIEFTATSTGADRDCSFSIKLEEPGQPPRTYHRGVCLCPPKDPKAPPPVQTVKVFLTAPSLAARTAVPDCRGVSDGALLGRANGGRSGTTVK